MAGQEGQLREEVRSCVTLAALSTHSSLMGRAGPETGRDLPKDTQQIRLDLGPEKGRENVGIAGFLFACLGKNAVPGIILSILHS